MCFMISIIDEQISYREPLVTWDIELMVNYFSFTHFRGERGPLLNVYPLT